MRTVRYRDGRWRHRALTDAARMLAACLFPLLFTARVAPAGLPGGTTFWDDAALRGRAPAHGPDHEVSHPALLEDEPHRAGAPETGGESVEPSAPKSSEGWRVNDAHGDADTLRFECTEATWVSIDVHPDGTKLVLDILGDLYTLPLAGGAATRITSGLSFDYQPRWSPDGTKIVYTSDVGGSDNLWIADADGSNRRPVTDESGFALNCPAWTPDGEFIVGKKRITDWSSIGTTELWIFDVYGGSGVQITKKDQLPEVNEPVVSPDGRFIYFSTRASRYQYNRNVFAGIYQIRRFDRVTGQVTGITDGYGGSCRPTLSRDGKSLAFIRRDRLDSVLYLFDLETGRERPLWNGLSGDMQENFATAGAYPVMSFTPDGSAIVVWAQGKLWSVSARDGSAKEIPFRAPVEQAITKALRFPRAIATEELDVRMISWPVEAPDGSRLVFSALGSLWELRLTHAADVRAAGAPRRLTTQGGLAYAPAFSRDGKWIAYVSWSDGEGGHLWKMPASGGRSTRLTELPSQYANPSFSADGSKIVFLRSDNASLRGHDLSSESRHDIVWVPSAGGAPQYVLSIPARGSANRMPRPVFNPDASRVFYLEFEGDNHDEAKTFLYSVQLDGTDRQAHLQVKYADDIVPSPDGRWAVYTEYSNSHLVRLPGVGREPISVDDGKGPVPTHQFSRDGGEWVNWADGGATVTWSYGPEYYRVSVDSLLASWERERLSAGKKKIEPKSEDDDENDDDEDDDDENGSDDDDGDEDDGDEDDGDDQVSVPADTISISLKVPRARPSGVVALTGARILTMRDDGVIENGTIVIRDHRIEAVGSANEVTVPAGARVFDVKGKTIMPGLVDIHAHLHYNTFDLLPEQQWENWCNLAYGVTTTHDPSASTYAVFTEAEMIEAGVMKGPRTFSTGMVLYGAKGGIHAKVESLEDARNQIRRMKRLGAWSVKSYQQPRREQRQWLIQAAREESVLVVPEGGGEFEGNLSMVLDGHTTIEHCLPITPLGEDVAKLFAASGTAETPTLLVAYGGLSGEHWFYQHHEVWQNEKLLRFTPRPALDARAIRRPVTTIDGDWHHIEVARSCKRILDEGGVITLGAHGQRQGLGAHWEMWSLVQGGMTNAEALRCATRNGAWALGLDHEIGTLEAGKLADLLVLDQNPLERIENSESLRYVMKNGELFEAETMKQLWPAEQPCPRFAFQVWGPPLPAKP